MAQTKREKYWIKEGIAVAHRTNLNFMYTVKRILKKSKEIQCNKEDKSAYEKDGKWYRRKTYLDGIEVQFVNRNQEIDTTIFHSKEIIPWDIAKEGFMAVNEWLKSDIS